ncbi:hypothetical protein B0F90DRAFT_1809285 [Multifurca ochricompacta]|uniref:Uncharacterized protein n=1 Tax=Multifurca ochricompacta TaxID=376703 RepID=A0AAD4M724_9AGAM|nr:hypothetical protein B0F90DRAFT_1809285 [Multifurca ochricompacta]
MNHLDTSWCPVCSRQILPKRYLVPVSQQPSIPAPIPAPPPSSPIASGETSPTQPLSAQQVRRTTGTVRQKGAGGLVRGTGRVKPNGAIKRSDSKRNSYSPVPPVTQVTPAIVKHRTVIDQNPTPLYCSDECRLADLNSMYGGLSLDYNPDRDPRDSPPLPPVPHNSFTTIPPIIDESDSSSPSTSPDSQGSTLATEYNPFSAVSPVMNPSIAALARIYDFPPLPPRPAILDYEPREAPVQFDNDYQSGVMMAARRIKETFCSHSDSTKTLRPFGQATKERKPIPGWTDGSDSWRSSVYSLAPPSAPTSSTSITNRDERPAAYGSFVASPHRSTGVYSTIGENNTPMASKNSAGPSRLTSAARANTSDDLYSKYALAFSRRSDSRSSLSGSAPQAQSFPTPARRREHGILKPGAEGKLLVPDVKLKASSASSFYSTDGASVSSLRSSSTRSVIRSPLSRQGSEVSVESGSDSTDAFPDRHQPCSLPTAKRPTTETRSWSYDNMATKEIRYERRVVDGVTTVVETEVEVQPQLKRLFLFPGKERR